MSIILFTILSIALAASIVTFVVYKRKKNTYDCTENGCEFNSNGNGKFNTKKSCEKSCEKTIKSNTLRTSTPKKRTKPFKVSKKQENDTPVKVGVIESIIDTIVPLINDEEVIAVINQQVNDEEVNDEEVNINELYNNVENIREQIKRKKQSIPYYATTKQAVSVITDYDTFPYPRYFRGVPEMSEPIIADREAGWRPRHDNSYESKVQLDLKPECVMGSLQAQQEQLYRNECSPSGECSVTF